MVTADVQHRLETFAADCRAAGFDLSAILDTAWFNDHVGADMRLPDFGRNGALAVVVANSRALWPVFLEHLREQPQRLATADPIDSYSEVRIGRAARASFEVHTILWAHTIVPRAVPMQRLAHLAGLAHLSPANLCVHPTFGPWIGLRAVIVVDADGPGGSATPLTDPCGACAHACLPAYRAVADRPLDRQSWRDWLDVRLACPLGAAHRYDEAQSYYHYTKDRTGLRAALAPGDPN